MTATVADQIQLEIGFLIVPINWRPFHVANPMAAAAQDSNDRHLGTEKQDTNAHQRLAHLSTAR